MRITNLTILNRSLESAARGLEDMARLERQVATGRRFQTLSEAPLDGRAILELDAGIRATAQYGRNIQAALSRLAVEDAALDEISGTLGRAREIALQQGGSVANAAARDAARLEVQALKESVIQLVNRQQNGAYVFGGPYADRPPLDASGALDPVFPARGAQQYEIGPGLLAPAVHDAGQIAIDSDVIGALDALDAALAANDAAAIQASAERLRTSVTSVQELVTQVGARQTRMDLALDAHQIVDEGLRQRRSTLLDVPLEEAVTLLAARHTAYQATLLATTRILDSSLVNYLR